MELDLRELQIIEKLLTNRINADYDQEVDELLCKVREQIIWQEYQPLGTDNQVLHELQLDNRLDVMK